jgi:predicted adenylyl cyclase CyaB
MRETEVKILDINRADVEARLAALGAVRVFEGTLRAQLFDFEDRHLGRSGNLLRLRSEGDRIVLTHKGPVADGQAKVRDEIEVTVSDYDNCRNLLAKLGLTPLPETRKRRTAYNLQNAQVVIDKYAGAHAYIPEFLEIEAPDLESIYDIARKLGFSPKDCKPWNFRTLARHYSPDSHE